VLLLVLAAVFALVYGMTRLLFRMLTPQLLKARLAVTRA